MSKKVLLFGSIGIIVVVAAGGYFYTANKKTTSDQPIMEEKMQVEEQEDPSTALRAGEEESFSGSLFDLLNRGKAVKCTFQSEDESGEYNAVTYAAGSKVRQDIETVENGEKTEVHMIIKDQAMYVWSSDQPGEGTKMPYEATDEEIQDFGQGYTKQADRSYQDFNQKFDYKCRNWREDNSVFTEPGNVNFTDLGAMIEKMQDDIAPMMEGITPPTAQDIPAPTSDIPDVLKEMCGNCDNAETAAEQAACRQALGC